MGAGLFGKFSYQSRDGRQLKKFAGRNDAHSLIFFLIKMPARGVDGEKEVRVRSESTFQKNGYQARDG
jgi:hypothetical protein